MLESLNDYQTGSLASFRVQAGLAPLLYDLLAASAIVVGVRVPILSALHGTITSAISEPAMETAVFT